MKDLNVRKNDATPRAISVLCDWFATKAKNATIWDTNNTPHIDFASGIAVLNVGHCHDRVISAVKKQLDKFTHTAYQITPYENYIELAEKINVYPLAGLHYANATAHLKDLGLGDNESDGKIGVNLGAGADFKVASSLSIGVEAKYQIIEDFNQFVISAGITYSF